MGGPEGHKNPLSADFVLPDSVPLNIEQMPNYGLLFRESFLRQCAERFGGEPISPTVSYPERPGNIAELCAGALGIVVSGRPRSAHPIAKVEAAWSAAEDVSLYLVDLVQNLQGLVPSFLGFGLKTDPPCVSAEQRTPRLIERFQGELRLAVKADRVVEEILVPDAPRLFEVSTSWMFSPGAYYELLDHARSVGDYLGSRYRENPTLPPHVPIASHLFERVLDTCMRTLHDESAGLAKGSEHRLSNLVALVVLDDGRIRFVLETNFYQGGAQTKVIPQLHEFQLTAAIADDFALELAVIDRASFRS